MKKTMNNLKKILTISILFLQTSLYAQKIENLYVHMPDRLDPVLNSKQRHELIEYAKVGQSDTVTTRNGSKAYLLFLDTLNAQIKIKNTSSSTFEMKLLHFANGQPFVGIIRTVCAPVCHSMIQFCDTTWNKIPLQFNYPKAIDWLNVKNIQDSTIEVAHLQKILENTFITLTFEQGSNRLIATNNSLDFLSKADKKMVLPYVITQPILFQLQEKTWVKEP